MNYELFEKNQKKIMLVDLKKENNNYFSELMSEGLKKYIRLNKKIGILINKKGYSSGMICPDCGYIFKCRQCEVNITFHLDIMGKYFGICHICKSHYEHTNMCPNCQSTKFDLYGIGIEKIQKILLHEYKMPSLIIESETANSLKKISIIKENIKKYKIILGTSLLTTPVLNYNFDLIIFVNADIGLHVPDYNASYVNYLYITEAIQKHQTVNFIVQSYNPDHYAIYFACQQNHQGFLDKEKAFRIKFGFPPYKQIAVILYKNEIEERLFNQINTLYQELLYLKEKYEFVDLEIFSTPPLIYKKFGKYRYNLILKSSNLRSFLDIAFSKLKIYQRGFKIDREPQNLI